MAYDCASRLICCIVLGIGFFIGHSAYAADSPATDDLWDVSQGAEVLTSTPAVDPENMLGDDAATFSSEQGNTIFGGGVGGTVQAIEWRTPTPVVINHIALFAYHDPPPRDASYRGFREFRLYVQENSGTFELVHTFEPSNPYGGGSQGNELAYSADIDPVSGRRFRAEFIQAGSEGSYNPGSRIIELDGFGATLPTREPTPSQEDLWDINHGAEITDHSGVIDGSDIQDMFGGTFTGRLGENGNTVFRDGEPAGTVHWVEWRTPERVTIERLALFAAHDGVRPWAPTRRDARFRGFREFRLYAKNETTGVFEKIYEYFPANPYGWGNAPQFEDLEVSASILPTSAQEFRAEFVQYGDDKPDASGPRIVELDGYGTAAPVRDPVVLVPGLLASHNRQRILKDLDGGTWDYTPTAGRWYEPLVERLETEGYELGTDLFIVFYDWRQEALRSAIEYLIPNIKEAKLQSGSDKVDIVAHSMGGLVARAYIQSNAFYEDDVDQLILIGTPNLGAADAYAVWESGRLPKRWNFLAKQWIRRIERLLKKEKDLKGLKRPLSYRTFFPSLRELIPINPFVNRAGTILNPSQLTEQNTFLQGLDDTKDRLNNRVREVITIAGDEVQTLNSVPILNSRTREDVALERWRDGHANPDPPVADSTAGDQTVLKDSVQGVGGEHIVLSGTTHEELPGAAQDEVVTALLEPDNPKADFIPSRLASAALGVDVMSPIMPTIHGPNGEILSADENTFEDAVFDWNPSDPDDMKMLTVVDPPQGTYAVELTGTGTGEYTVVTSYADEDETLFSEHEGTTTDGETEEVIFVVGDDSFIAPPGDIPYLLCELKNTIRRLRKEKHIKIQAAEHLGERAQRMCRVGKKYHRFSNRFGIDHKKTQRVFQRLRHKFARFATKLERHINRAHLDKTAIREIASLRDRLEDAGLSY